MSNTFQSEHFTLQQLGEGLYAAIATELGAGFSNTGVVDLGERTLVFDAFENPQAAEDLLKACLQLTGRSPETVIISHWHPDHWGGLQVFADSQILATEATRQAMLPIAKDMAEDKKDLDRLEKQLRKIEAQLARATSPAKRKTLQINTARLRHELEALPILKPTLPNQTFEAEVIFQGTDRKAELVAMDKRHTISDCILRLPEQKVAFIGDIGFFQSQPFMYYGYPTEWVALLNEMAGWDIDTFVPGHGPVGSKANLELEAKYILALEELVHGVVQAGGSVKDALRQTLPAPFDTWQTVGQRFEANVRAAYKRQSAAPPK